MSPGPRRYRRLLRISNRRGRIREEIDEELRFHIDRKVERFVAAGMSRDEAEAEAMKRFGDLDEVREAVWRTRERRRMTMRWSERLGNTGQDLRFAARYLVRNPLFTAVAVLTLALGIGMNTAIFSVVDGVLFRALPYPEPEELTALWVDVTRRGGPDDEWWSYANFHDAREQAASFEALGAWGGAGPTLTGRGAPEQLLGAVVTEGMFGQVLQVAPALGRDFVTDEFVADGPAVALISHGLWQRAFGGDPGAVGSTVVLNGTSVEIVGVMPEGFRPPFVPQADIWLPVQVDLSVRQARRGNFSWRVIGRLADGASLARAQAELDELGTTLERTYPDSNGDMGFRVVSLRDDLTSDARASLLVLLAAVGFVLLIACVNVANLLLARAMTRTGELALRSALGAGRSRILGQLLTESLVLAVLGGVLGVGLAWVGVELLVGVAPSNTPRLDAVTLDARVLGFTALATLGSGLLFGVVPAVEVAGRDLHGSLKESARTGGAARTRLRDALVVGQVGIALVLLVGAGLLMRTFQNMRTADLGFEPEGVLTMQINLPPARYGSVEERLQFYDELQERLRALPGVEQVALTSTVPLTGFDSDVDFHIEGRALAEPSLRDAAWFRRVTEDYFDLMGMEVVAGRGFTRADDRESTRVVVINETLADGHFAGEDPLGQRLILGNPTDPDAYTAEVVGVVQSVRNFGIREDARDAFYLPYVQATSGVLWPVLRTSVPPESVIAGVRSQVAVIDGSLAAARVEPMADIVARAMGAERAVASVLAAFAVLALVLAVVGLYGVISFSVASRVREMGIRIALGAESRQIRALVVRRGLVLVLGGIVLGLILAAATTRLLSGLLFGVRPNDVTTLVTVSGVLAFAAFAASLAPALRATRVSPVEVLRSD